MESAEQLGREEAKESNRKRKLKKLYRVRSWQNSHQRYLYKQAGSNAALGAMAGKFGAGELTGRAIDEAIAGIDDPEQQLAKIKELSTGKLATLSAAHALANYVGLKIGLGCIR